MFTAGIFSCVAGLCLRRREGPRGRTGPPHAHPPTHSLRHIKRRTSARTQQTHWYSSLRPVSKRNSSYYHPATMTTVATTQDRAASEIHWKRTPVTLKNWLRRATSGTLKMAVLCRSRHSSLAVQCTPPTPTVACSSQHSCACTTVSLTFVPGLIYQPGPPVWCMLFATTAMAARHMEMPETTINMSVNAGLPL